MSADSPRPLRVVTVVTLEVSREWAALLDLLQRQANAGAEWLLVCPRYGIVAPVGEMVKAGGRPADDPTAKVDNSP